MNNKKIIGILGGMGPATTVSFFNDIVKISQHKYGAEQDTDFPNIYIFNTALEGFNETGFEDMTVVQDQLINDVRKLESWGAEFIVMPCNTVHHFIDELRKSINIPIISIIESTIDVVKKMGYQKVGVISSASTRNLGLYEKKLNEENINCIIVNDDEQKLLDNVILSVMKGKQSDIENKILHKIINRLKDAGADVVILGCTELPLAINESESVLPLLNTIKILAERSVDYSLMQ